MSTISEFDQYDAQIAHHGQQHLAKTLGLRLLAALELNLIELGDPVDNLGDISAEARGDFFFRCRRIFDDVVQNRSNQGVGVEMQFGENFCRRHRMGDIRLAAQAFLSMVCSCAEFCGGAHAFDLLGGQVGRDLGQQIFEARSAPRARQQAQ